MQYYKKNMKILSRRFKKLYSRIKQAEKNEVFKVNKNLSDNILAEIVDKKNGFTIYIEKARKNGYTMKVKNNEKEIYFHSKYDPEREAEKIVKDFGFSSKKQIFILGLGLGLYLNQFNNKKKYNKIIIIEPFLSIFYASLHYNDLSEFLTQQNIVLVIDDFDQIFDIIQMYIKINLENNIDFLEHKPSFNIFSKQYKKLYIKIKSSMSYKKIGLASNIQQARFWRDNIIHNLPHIINSPKADEFFNEFVNVPIICISAGPSLDKNISIIKQAKGKALILCVGTALKALMKNNIQPDIVVTMDGTIKNYEHFKQIEIPDSYLLTELGNHYLINEKWDDRQIFFSMKRNFSGWVEKIKGNYEVIKTGGTVAHSMVDFAYKLGGSPIVLVGQDLAYKDKKTHASGTTYENDIVNKKQLFKVDGVNEDKVFTDKSFKSMLSFFNNYFNKREGRMFIDATEGGAKIDNTEIMTLQNVINKYCLSNLNIKEKLDKKFESVKNENFLIKKVKDELKKTISELETSIKITKEQIEAMDSVKSKLSKNKSLSDKKLDSLEISFSKYEDELNNTNYIRFFIERILIAEFMKLDEITSKYYLSKRKSIEKRLDVYYKFRKKFLSELEYSLNLIKDLYLKKNGEIDLNKTKVRD